MLDTAPPRGTQRVFSRHARITRIAHEGTEALIETLAAATSRAVGAA